MTQLALNAKVLNIIKITLFFVNYSKKSNLFKKKRTHLSTQLVVKRIAILKKYIRQHLKDASKVDQILK